MIEDSVYPTNDRQEITAVPFKPENPDILLLYKAKQNVKDRKNLIKHVAAFIVIWFIIGLFYVGVIQGMASPEWRSVSAALQTIRGNTQYIPIDSLTTNYLDAVEELQWVVEYRFFHSYMPGIWYVILGVMFAWGGWIAVRVAKYIAEPIRNKLSARHTKKARPDPVIQEYNRLKNMAADELI